MAQPINSDSFNEAFDLASELATDEDGMVVVHKKWCSDPQDVNCPCQPLEVQPYTHVSEDETEGLVQ